MGGGGFNSILFISNLEGILVPNLGLLQNLGPFEEFLWWWMGGGWCLNVYLVIGFGPNLGLALWPRAMPINRSCDI